MTSTEFNRNEIEAPAEPGSIAAGAEIYRRMERRGKRRPMWMTVGPVVAVVVIVAGGVAAYEGMKPAPKPPVQAQATPPAAAPAQVAATTPPKQAPVVTPTPVAPVRVTHKVKIEHVRPTVTPVAHRRTLRNANTAAMAGEDTSAVTPAAQPIVRPAPAPVAATPAAPVQSTAPAPTVTAPPLAVTPAPMTASPPSASSAAPAVSSQTTPAPQ